MKRKVLDYSGSGRVSVPVSSIVNSEKVQRQVSAAREIAKEREMTRNTGYPPDAHYDNCEHEWKEAIDSMYSNEHAADVTCIKCRCPGHQDRATGDVYWPAT